MIADPTNPLCFEAHLGLAKILYDWNNLDEAESHALICSQLVAQTKNENEIGADILLARLMLSQNEYIKAESFFMKINVMAKSGQLAGRMQEAAELQVLYLLNRGEVKEAADFSNQFQLPIGRARTLLEQNKGSEAKEIIKTHRRNMEEQNFTHETLKASVVQVVIHNAIGELDGALLILSKAAAQAEKQGSIRLFVDEGVAMKTLLEKLQNQSSTSIYVSKLLAAFNRHLSEEMKSLVVTMPHLQPEVFSSRELDILRLIQEGHSNQQISERLFLSLSTVKWHNQNIFAKLDVQRRTEAVARALELKLL